MINDIKNDIARGMKISPLMKKYNMSRPKLKKLLADNNIEFNSKVSMRTKPSYEDLYHNHITLNQNVQTLCKHYNTHPKIIKEWFKYYNISRNYIRHKRCQRILTKAELYDLHINKKLSFTTIAKQLGTSDVTIGNWAKEYGISNILYSAGTSKPEQELRDFISNYIPCKKDRSAVPGYELDLFIPEKRIAFEYNGLYWHTEDKVGRLYHLHKQRAAEKCGIKLFHIFSNELDEKADVVKSIVLSKLNFYKEIIYARNCVLSINHSETRNFLNKNHLQGAPTNIALSISLLFNDEIVGCISYGRHHRNHNKNEIILNRLCFKTNTQIIGGAKRLFTNSLAHLNQYEKIVSWSDNRWSDGSVYKHLDFTLSKELPIQYWYYKSGQLYSMQSKQKKVINCPLNMTEREYMLQQGYNRIWDCGKKRWEYNLKF